MMAKYELERSIVFAACSYSVVEDTATNLLPCQVTLFPPACRSIVYVSIDPLAPAVHGFALRRGTADNSAFECPASAEGERRTQTSRGHTRVANDHFARAHQRWRPPPRISSRRQCRKKPVLRFQLYHHQARRLPCQRVLPARICIHRVSVGVYCRSNHC